MAVSVLTSANPASGQQDAANAWISISGTNQEVIDELAARNVSITQVSGWVINSTDVVTAFVKLK